MSRKIKSAFFLLLFLGAITIGLLFLFSDQIAVLNPTGMIGIKENRLLLLSTFIMLFVVIPVFILTFFIAWKYRDTNTKAQYSPEWDQNHLAEAIWWGVPLVIILVLGILTWRSCHELDPFKPIDPNAKRIRIQVVALQWKWLFIYPDQKIATVNFIQFPEQTPIDFEISADAPMNSFWIPKLGGQIYAMAGMKSKLHLIANETGSFRGSSAHISGEGFSGMTFVAKSSSQEDFEAWVASVQQSPDSLSLAEYKQLVAPSSYDPPAFYRLTESGLFEWIVMKYMMPMGEKDALPVSQN